MDPWKLVIAPSAYRHGVTDEDAWHAVAHYLALYRVNDLMVMVIGPSRTAGLLEVGIAIWNGDLAAVHAMRARPVFLRQMGL
ncbi:MAG: hypothetical protein HGA44_15740 [Cellulomonadaceae bacterium]|nr:hypothetical protein [Cellulomonadaceae bacterium]